MTKSLELIVAHDQNLGIGKNNDMPWQLPTDMAHFKHLTTEQTNSVLNTVIMGRKTWESIPEKFRPLPNRINIVLSRTPQQLPDNVLQAHSLNDAIEQAASDSRIFIIGGGQIFTEALQHPGCTALHVTHIHSNYDCDTHFPKYTHLFKQIDINKVTDTSGTNLSFITFSKK
jgi:dihydrofolate reductase / thymidylate synthase